MSAPITAAAVAARSFVPCALGMVRGFVPGVIPAGFSSDTYTTRTDPPGPDPVG